MPVRVVLGRVTTLENVYIFATLKNLRLLKRKFDLVNLVAVTLASAVCAGIGVYMIGDIRDTNGSLAQQVVAGSSIIDPAAYMMFILGVSGFLAGVFGCLAMCQRKRLQFQIFLIGVVEVSLLALICFILTLLFFTNVRTQVREKALASFLEDFSRADEERIAQVWNPLQQTLRCCGIRGYDDYQLTAKKTTDDVGMVEVPIPRSCCVSRRDLSGEPLNVNLCQMKRARYIFTHGCGELIQKSLTQNSGLMLIASILILIMEIVSGIAVGRMYMQLPSPPPTVAEPPLPDEDLNSAEPPLPDEDLKPAEPPVPDEDLNPAEPPLPDEDLKPAEPPLPDEDLNPAEPPLPNEDLNPVERTPSVDVTSHVNQNDDLQQTDNKTDR